ncbi:MAG: hypothetical protein AAF670_14925 [Planctomycetota bacterium]
MAPTSNSGENPREAATSPKWRWRRWLRLFLVLAGASAELFVFGLSVAFDKTSPLTSHADFIVLGAMVVGVMALGSFVASAVLWFKSLFARIQNPNRAQQEIDRSQS